MLFKPELNETAKAAGERVVRVASRARRRTVSITITLLILVMPALIAAGAGAWIRRMVSHRPSVGRLHEH